MKLSTLKKRAASTTTNRGHRLKWKNSIGWRGDVIGAIGVCKCGAYVQCLLKPEPNQIDIGGNALAIGCKKH